MRYESQRGFTSLSLIFFPERSGGVRELWRSRKHSVTESAAEVLNLENDTSP